MVVTEMTYTSYGYRDECSHVNYFS